MPRLLAPLCSHVTPARVQLHRLFALARLHSTSEHPLDSLDSARALLPVTCPDDRLRCVDTTERSAALSARPLLEHSSTCSSANCTTSIHSNVLVLPSLPQFRSASDRESADCDDHQRNRLHRLEFVALRNLCASPSSRRHPRQQRFALAATRMGHAVHSNEHVSRG